MNAPLYAHAERTEAVRNVHISKRTPAWEAVTDYRSLCYELEFELQRYQHANAAAIQWPLFLLSFAAAAGLALLPAAFAQWSCIVGLAAQPFWLYSTWHARQYGIFALAWLYVGVYTVGIAVH